MSGANTNFYQNVGADNLFGLPNTDEFNFDPVFDFSQPLDTSVPGGKKDSLSEFLAIGAQATNNPAPFSNGYGSFDDPNNCIDPALTLTSEFQPPTAAPKYRTDSGSEVQAIPGPNGQWLHPRNGRVLDERELRWDGDVPMTAAPATYVAPPQPTQPQSSFDPMLNPYPAQMDMGLQYNYPDPTAFAPVEYGPVDQMDVLPTIEEQADDDQSHNSSRRRRSSDKGRRINRRQPLYNVESPKPDQEKPWVRVNSATKGNTRTGKTNTYGDGPYRNTLHPFGVQNPTWTASNGTTFRYNQWGELNSVSFDAEHIERFLYDHPFHNLQTRATLPAEQQRRIAETNPKLILWIQKMPGDSAKRVNTQHGLKCRIRECPAGIYKSRTINTGHYRIAFDEQWATYGEQRNPMHVAAYAHLYCMERFFDLPRLCRDFDVRADDREIPGEPTGEWVAGLGQGTDEFKVARDFIMAAKTGKGADRWINYPSHNPDRFGARKLPHWQTLTHKLVERKAAATGHSKMKMMEQRGRSATQFFVNMGDLQLQIDTQQERNAQRSQAVRGRRTVKRKMVDEEDEAMESSFEGDEYESEGADEGDPEAEYNPRPTKRARGMSRAQRVGANQVANAYQLADASANRNDSIAGRLRGATYDHGPAPVAQMYPGQEASVRSRRSHGRQHDEDQVSPKTQHVSLFVQ